MHKDGTWARKGAKLPPQQVCASKVRYTLREAREKLNRHRGDPLRAYQCSVCNFWHMTSDVQLPERADGKPQPRRLDPEQEAT